MSARLPDFIIIGAMKAATSTLHEQLARQDGIFMSNPKEPCFFSDDEQWDRGLDWYRGLFAAARDGDLCGESSTHYTKLPTHPRTVERMRQHLPGDVRFIYIMRHPIDRLISHYIHEWTQRVISEPIDAALESHPELIAYSRYRMQMQPYVDAFGRERILPLFFERLTSHAQEALERVCAFIGWSGTPRWHEEASEQNVSSERLRRSPLRDAIVEFPLVRAVRRHLIPQSWRDRVKSLWMMKQRPQLSADRVARLTAIFDDDLAQLGEWFGLDDLTCSTFKQIAQRGQPSWRSAAGATIA